MDKQIQFELWEECNNKCTFCYMGKDNIYTPDNVKLNSLKNAYDVINNPDTFKEFNIVAYLGGEFFQGQLSNKEVKEQFFKLMSKSADLLRQNIIKEVWIYMTLTIGNQQDLYDTIQLFNGVTDKLWLLTSYDTVGRFHTQKMEDNWKYHMKKIHELYPEIRLNITTILSSDCIKKYLNNEISFKQLSKEYNSEMFFKQVGCGGVSPREYNKIYNIDFVPTRKLFIEFLRKFKQQETEQAWDKLFNIQYRCDVLYRNGNDLNHQMMKNIRYKDNRGAEIELDFEHDEKALELMLTDCGHISIYHAYSDCDGCVLCDKEAIADG